MFLLEVFHAFETYHSIIHCRAQLCILYLSLDSLSSVYFVVLLLLHDPFFFYFQALNKKEHKGCDSPDPECDPYSMSSMNFEEKYNRMNEDYQRVLQQNQLRVSRIETSIDMWKYVGQHLSLILTSFVPKSQLILLTFSVMVLLHAIWTYTYNYVL